MKQDEAAQRLQYALDQLRELEDKLISPQYTKIETFLHEARAAIAKVRNELRKT